MNLEGRAPIDFLAGYRHVYRPECDPRAPGAIRVRRLRAWMAGVDEGGVAVVRSEVREGVKPPGGGRRVKQGRYARILPNKIPPNKISPVIIPREEAKDNGAQ